MAGGRRPGRDDNERARPRRRASAKGDKVPPVAKPVKPIQPPVAKPVPPTAKPVQPVRPPTAKPVQPVRPPTAKPVAPARPPVAKPMPPTAKPVQPARPPAAKPVAPAKPGAARPVATPASSGKASPRGGNRRISEQEVGRTSRSGRSAHGHAGMSNALKTALVSAVVTLGVLAIAVLAGGPEKKDMEKALNTAGSTAVAKLANIPASFWTGKAPTSNKGAVPQAKAIFFALFGDGGRDFWERREAEANRPFEDGMDQEEIADIKKAKKRWQAAIKKWEKSGNDGGGSKDRKALDRELRLIRDTGNAMAKAGGNRFLGAWIRKASDKTEGEYIASEPTDSGRIAYDWSKHKPGQNWVDGTVTRGRDRWDARIYGASVRGATGKDAMRAYVAIWKGPLDATTGLNGIGLIMLLLGPLVVGGLAYALASGFTKSVKDLAREVDKLGTKGDPTRKLRAQGPEASAVAHAVERMVSNLEFRNQHGDEDLDEIVERERKVAEEIHGALMHKNPPRLSNYEVETLFKPGFEIGGDHFEYFPIDEDHLGVILLDTNVRGVTAALVQATTRSYVRAAAPGELSPAEVLRQVNRNLAGELPPGRHVTALSVVINTKDGKATIASAGHLPLLVYRHAVGKVAKVNPEGIALGLDDGRLFDKSLQEGDIPLETGDRIVLYTDGALNVQNEEGEEYGEARFYQAVAKDAPKNSQAFVNFLGAAIDQFHLNSQQNDDITISTVKRLK